RQHRTHDPFAHRAGVALERHEDLRAVIAVMPFEDAALHALYERLRGWLIEIERVRQIRQSHRMSPSNESRRAIAQLILSSFIERRGASMRGVWPPRSTLLPWKRVRWSIGAGSSQSLCFIAPDRP